jgi:hypothetical protein
MADRPPAQHQRVRVFHPRYNFRDRFGHWVAPTGRAGKPCPHLCCKNERAHPRSLPVRIDRAVLRSLDPDELEWHLNQYLGYYETHSKGFHQIEAEFERREHREQAARARLGRARERREQVNAELGDEQYRAWLQAENGIQGAVLLNKAGQRAGVNERTLFSGPQSRADKYASDELKEWWETHPRPTREYFTRQRVREQREQRERYERSA